MKETALDMWIVGGCFSFLIIVIVWAMASISYLFNSVWLVWKFIIN